MGGGESSVRVWYVLVVDGVVEEYGHDRSTVVTVPPCHSQLLIHFLKLQQLQRVGQSCHGNSMDHLVCWTNAQPRPL